MKDPVAFASRIVGRAPTAVLRSRVRTYVSACDDIGLDLLSDPDLFRLYVVLADVEALWSLPGAYVLEHCPLADRVRGAFALLWFKQQAPSRRGFRSCTAETKTGVAFDERQPR